MAKFTTLYSGSSGNSAIVEEDGAYIMVDIGKSARSTAAALNSLGLTREGLRGICITHEHSDHISGLRVFTKSINVPVLSGQYTLAYLQDHGHVNANPLVPANDVPLEIGGFEIRAFPTSHDAVDCCGFHITTPKGRTLAIATDLGIITPEVFTAMDGANMVAIEANYDQQMLTSGPYPYYLKKRIASQKGHLNNIETAHTVASLIERGGTKFAFCHMSESNNLPMLLRDELDKAFGESGIVKSDVEHLQVALRHEVSPFIEF